jgi:hypothetical protein
VNHRLDGAGLAEMPADGALEPVDSGRQGEQRAQVRSGGGPPMPIRSAGRPSSGPFPRSQAPPPSDRAIGRGPRAGNKTVVDRHHGDAAGGQLGESPRAVVGLVAATPSAPMDLDGD